MDVIFLPFIIAVIFSYGFTPFAKEMAYKIGAIDIPKDERRMHSKPIPRLGGLAIYMAIIIAFVLFSDMPKNQVMGIIAGSSIIFFTGVVDDVHPLSAKVKMLLQIVAASVIMAVDIRILGFGNPFVDSGYVHLGWLSYPVTLFWIVGITNTVNLIDGLDGLAAGISAISASVLAYVALINGWTDTAVLTAIVAGSCIGFLPYNFNPAQIFMGDGGSLLLGFLLSTISVTGTLKSATVLTIAVPVLALGVPIFDTTFAIVRRLIMRKPIMQADKGHLHHRLLTIGFDQKGAVVRLYSISVLLGVGGAFIASGSFINAMVALAIGITLIMIPISQTTASGERLIRTRK
ncbi:MAG: undecaprenyl/decaprenyl-phosphate alpha-N-acetylglucosaminyl 1-phosphate transferase [Clostridia bacterium]|nr:undecaprenyl/decaprenyl-phosphate alpha-N-acetylglucosaminyl 1-phosphate transferase [Clostridia bacterium]